jgi:hypothetical protein
MMRRDGRLTPKNHGPKHQISGRGPRVSDIPKSLTRSPSPEDKEGLHCIALHCQIEGFWHKKKREVMPAHAGQGDRN